MLLPMVYGKICNRLAGKKSTMSCYICGAKLRKINSMVINGWKLIDYVVIYLW